MIKEILAGFLSTVLHGPKGTTDLAAYLDTQLTETRADYLDNLPDLAGPAALQVNLSGETDTIIAVGDAQPFRPQPNTVNQGALVPLLQACELVLCDIEAKVQQLAGAQAHNITITCNILSEVTLPPQPGTTNPIASYPPGTPTIYGYSGPIYEWALESQDVSGVGAYDPVTRTTTQAAPPTVVTIEYTDSGNPPAPPGQYDTISTAQYNGNPINTLPINQQTDLFWVLMKVINPTTVQQQLAPPQTTIVSTPTQFSASIPPVTLPTLGGCQTQSASGVQVTLNGLYPPLGQADSYLCGLGNPAAPNAQYLGLSWSGSGNQFVFTAKNAQGTVTNQPLDPYARFPFAYVWRPGGAALQTADGGIYTIPASACPSATAPLQLSLPAFKPTYMTLINVAAI